MALVKPSVRQAWDLLSEMLLIMNMLKCWTDLNESWNIMWLFKCLFICLLNCCWEFPVLIVASVQNQNSKSIKKSRKYDPDLYLKDKNRCPIRFVEMMRISIWYFNINNKNHYSQKYQYKVNNSAIQQFQ